MARWSEDEIQLPLELFVARFEYTETGLGIFRDNAETVLNAIALMKKPLVGDEWGKYKSETFIEWYTANQPSPHNDFSVSFIILRDAVKFGCLNGQKLLSAFGVFDEHFEKQIKHCLESELIIARTYMVRPRLTETIFGEVIYNKDSEVLVQETHNINEIRSWDWNL
jgi:hypothetical protein